MSGFKKEVLLTQIYANGDSANFKANIDFVSCLLLNTKTRVSNTRPARTFCAARDKF